MISESKSKREFHYQKLRNPILPEIQTSSKAHVQTRENHHLGVRVKRTPKRNYNLDVTDIQGAYPSSHNHHHLETLKAKVKQTFFNRKGNLDTSDI